MPFEVFFKFVNYLVDFSGIGRILPLKSIVDIYGWLTDNSEERRHTESIVAGRDPSS